MATTAEAQVASAGVSLTVIHEAALKHAGAVPGLRWADIGCGTGELIREVRDRHEPRALVATDLLPWLADDLRSDVAFIEGDAQAAIGQIGEVDRLLMVEVLEHLEAPWATLRAAARAVASGGCLVLTTPNVRSLRHGLDLSLRGRLTSFHETNSAHLTPVLPHVASRILQDEGLQPSAFYCLPDMIPVVRRTWPSRLAGRVAALNASFGLSAWRP